MNHISNSARKGTLPVDRSGYVTGKRVVAPVVNAATNSRNVQFQEAMASQRIANASARSKLGNAQRLGGTTYLTGKANIVRVATQG